MWMAIVVVGLIQAVVISLIVYSRSRHMNDARVALYTILKDEVAQKEDLWSRVAGLRAEMAPHEEFVVKARDFMAARDALKVERGKVTITQAELESTEGRLRELEEITRELEASTTETKEELKILQKKESELQSKNEELRGQIAESTAKMDALMKEIEMTAQMQEQVSLMKAELFRAEEQTQTLLNEIQQINEQYFNLKRRYDALDVEYAQLYQQFTEQRQR